MKLAEILGTSVSYIGEIEINNKVPSMSMVERIANALNIEPFWLFVNDKDRSDWNTPPADNYLECLSAPERQELAKRIITSISNNVEQILNPENNEKTL